MTEDEKSCLRPLIVAVGRELAEFAAYSDNLTGIQGNRAEELALAVKFRQGYCSGIYAAVEKLTELTELTEESNNG